MTEVKRKVEMFTVSENDSSSCPVTRSTVKDSRIGGVVSLM